jgi:hypothetical protein
MITGPHVEVVREAAAVGERHVYTKQFLATDAGDFRAWTHREARILASLAGRGVRCIPALVPAATGNCAMQTFDAGASVEQLALLRLERDGRVVPHAFADCAHWWALARHMLRVLDTLHGLHVVHRDIHPRHVCVPVLPADFVPGASAATLTFQFARLALIDFAFSLAPGEPPASPMPSAPAERSRYQSPRLRETLAAGRTVGPGAMSSLDWRCDMYSLAAMLRLSLPAPGMDGWTVERHGRALALLAALDDAHDREIAPVSPHPSLIEMCEAAIEDDLVASLVRGFAVATVDGRPEGPPPSSPLARGVSAPTAAVAGVPVRDDVAVATEIGAESSWVPPVAARPSTIESLAGRNVRIEAPAALRPHARKRPLHAPTLATLTAIALALAVGLAVYSGDRQQDVVARPDATTTSRSAPVASGPPSGERLAAASPAARGSPPAARPATDPGTLPADAATAQRAADADAQDKPKTQAQVTASLPQPPVSEPAPAAIAGTAKPSRSAPSAPPALSPPSVEPAVASPPAEPAVASPPVAAVASPPAEPAVATPPVAPSRSPPDTQVAASGDAAANAPSAENSPRTAGSEAPLTRRPAASSRPDPQPVTTIPHPAFEDVVSRTQRDVARVLASAATAGPGDDERIRDVARSMRPVAAAPHVPTESPTLARQLNDKARAAWERNDVDAALDLQHAAFRANPNDPEVTGNLAFYYLKARPVQPDLARRLALYALAARGQKFPEGRFQDWGTLAVANALAGRERDAAAAMVVMLNVSGSPERACRAARLAVAQYGDALKAPTEAMLSRARARGVRGAPSCS